MRLVLAGFVLALLLPGIAAAGCGGRDLMPALAKSDPDAHARIRRSGDEITNGRGIFWEVRREGLAPSYLFGTYHDTEAEGISFTEAVRARFSDARVLIVELTDDEQRRMRDRIKSDPGFVLAPDGNGLIAGLGERERGLAAAALEQRGMDLAAASRLQPWMLFSLLGVPACQLALRAAGAPVLDQVLVRDARRLGKPVKGLETYQQALGSLAQMEPADIAAMLVDLVASSDREEDLRATMMGFYRRENIAAIARFGALTAPDPETAARTERMMQRFTEAVIVARNRAWLEVLVPELERGGVFAAFGALHLPGKDGIIELLRQRGFAVVRARL